MSRQEKAWHTLLMTSTFALFPFDLAFGSKSATFMYNGLPRTLFIRDMSIVLFSHNLRR